MSAVVPEVVLSAGDGAPPPRSLESPRSLEQPRSPEQSPSPPQLRLRVLGRAFPGGLWVFDRNWLYTEVALTAAEPRALRGEAFLRAEDFAAFAAELAALRAGARAAARFAPRDPWVEIAVRAAGGGGWQAEVRARDGGSERAARFRCALPEPGMAALERTVRAVVECYPCLT